MSIVKSTLGFMDKFALMSVDLPSIDLVTKEKSKTIEESINPPVIRLESTTSSLKLNLLTGAIFEKKVEVIQISVVSKISETYYTACNVHTAAFRLVLSAACAYSGYRVTSTFLFAESLKAVAAEGLGLKLSLEKYLSVPSAIAFLAEHYGYFPST